MAHDIKDVALQDGRFSLDKELVELERRKFPSEDFVEPKFLVK